jgi:hypothetical protein
LVMHSSIVRRFFRSLAVSDESRTRIWAGIEQESRAVRLLMEDSKDPNRSPVAEWSMPVSPTRLAVVFDCHPETLKRRLRDQTIRNRKLSPRRYQVSIDSIPIAHREKYRQRTYSDR